MKIIGKVVQICAKQEGEKDGRFWERQTMVIETLADKPLKVALTFFGERRAAMLKEVNVGDILEVAFLAESRKFNERWYTELSAFGFTRYVPPQTKKIPLDGAETAVPASQVHMNEEDEPQF